MVKKVSKKRKVISEKRQTNWVLIGGVVALGVLALFSLLFLSLQEPAVSRAASLEAYCNNNPDNCISKGDESAPVTIYEISDYGCTHCRTYYTQTEPLIDERYIQSGDVHYVVIPYALSEATVQAANGGLCAAEQERFFEYSAAMFAQYDEPDARQQEGILRAGEAAGVDLANFNECLSQSRYNDVLQKNIAAVGAAGVSSTPNFFINGKRVEGAQPFAAFQQQIDSLLRSRG